jgi:hypothetical protein
MNTIPANKLNDVIEMADKIRGMVLRYDSVSFAELSNNIPGFSDVVDDGDIKKYTALIFNGMSNLIIWINISDIGTWALSMLQKENVVKLRPCSALVYIVDGMTLNFPIAKRPPKAGYKTEHWIPCVLHI